MKTKQIVVLLAVLAMSMPLAAQMGMGMVPRMPEMSGIWQPVVGAGGSYEITNSDGTKSQMEITIVGKEDVAGKAGYWMETVTSDPHSGGKMYMKYLLSTGASGMALTKTIMQMAGRSPMEMDTSMMGGHGLAANGIPADIRSKANVVGSESVTVPAGTFACQHFRAKDDSFEVWISDIVSPWGVVKMQGTNNSMGLTKVIRNAKDHITGKPKPFDPAQMMRQGQ